MKLGDLIRDDATGRASHSKLYAHLGNLAMTAGFLKVVWTAGPGEAVTLLFLVYGGLVAGSQVASKLIGLRWGAKNGNGAAKPPGGA